MKDGAYYGDGTRWRIHKSGGERPVWVIRPPMRIAGTTRYRTFLSFETACKAFAQGSRLSEVQQWALIPDMTWRPW